jgi:LDH2 family malate/lactate/ureidoglycolate dehydrogenase
MLDALAALPPAEGEERVYYAGLKGRESEEHCDREGVPLTRKVWEAIKDAAQSLGVREPAIRG